ncbi:MAG: NAD(P)-dependent oxidoreductase [Pseudobutyrivibrio sp.]|nr:NAD(P)-dependent oxidoreductase [Pseudobutyrivibrio sp.]
MINTIVIGANGFIGANLCKYLVSRGIFVYAVVRNEKSDISRLKNLVKTEMLKIVYSDMHDLRELENEFLNVSVDVLYYLAWQGVTGESRADYEMQLDNVKCLCDAVIFARNIKCQRFVGAGTMAEIDVNNYSGLDGSTPNPVSAYGVAKLSAHYLSKAMCCQHGIEHVWAYISNTYGEGDSSSNFINFAINTLKSSKPNDFTQGEQYYDFVNVKDIAQGLYCLGARGKNCYSYYIGSGDSRKLREYIEIIRDAIDPTIELNLGAIPYNGILTPRETFDCNKITKDTGYKPEILFEQGIKDLINHE